MTTQVWISNIEDRHLWYETLLKKKPDFIPQDGCVEWEFIPDCWLQVAGGNHLKLIEIYSGSEF